MLILFDDDINISNRAIRPGGGVWRMAEMGRLGVTAEGRGQSPLIY
jgi:hypothetical protein